MTFIRKPLLFLLVMVVAASLAASGRFSLRLFFDTAITLAAVPIVQVLAFSFVYWTGRRPVGFATAVDDFFDGSWAWFIAFAIVGFFGGMRYVPQACAVAAAMVSLPIDWRYFRTGLGRGTRRAFVDVALQRAVGWSATIAYFLATTAPKAGSLLPDIMSSVWGRS